MKAIRSPIRYRAYGLTIDSDITLPELSAASEPFGACDLRVRLGKGRRAPSQHVKWVFCLELPTGAPWLSCGRQRDGYLVRFADVAQFSVTMDGREITCYPAAANADDDVLRHLLIDQVIPLTFKLRGREALHATAVQTPLGACAFIGPTGSGKSTLAAAFLRAGYRVISDDCLLVYADACGIRAVPAYAGVRLWKDALAAMGDDRGRLLPVARYTTKLRWLPRDVVESFPTEAQPLRRIYSLTRSKDAPSTGRGHRLRLEPLAPRAAFMELVDATFRLDATDRVMLTREFRFWERTALSVPMRRLWVADDLFSASARESVLADMATN